MKQFLTDQAKDDVLTTWRGLKLKKGESMQRYTNNFWDLHFKAIVYKKIDFSKQKKQCCAGLNEDMKTHINTQKPKTISEVIHHSLVAAKIFAPNKSFVKSQDNAENNFNKDRANKDAKASGNKDHCANGSKKKEGKEYKGQNKISPVELEKYCKENYCF